MMTPQQTAITEQLAAITLAAEFFQRQANELTDTISPNTPTWADVATFAQVAEWARGINEQATECGYTEDGK